MVGDARLGIECGDLCRVEDFALADFEKTSARCQSRQGLGDELAGQRIERRIDTGAAGDTQNLGRKSDRARIEYVADAERFEESAFFVVASGREDFSAEQRRYLDCG